MADDAQLLQALQAAHDAGDEQAAIEIAKQLNSQPVSPVVARPQPAPVSAADKPGGENWMAKYGPLSGMSGTQKFLAGAGQSFYDTGRGISQMFGGQNAQDTDEQRNLDAPLDRSGYGLAGNVVGGLAQSFIPGIGAEAAGAKIAAKLGTSPGALKAAQAIYRIAAPSSIGAAYGATSPVGTDETRLGNTGRGAIAGEVGKVLGMGTNSILRTGEDALTAGARKGAAIAAKYKIPLSMPQLSGGMTGFVSDTLDKLPFSGASERADNQKAAFNDALGKTAGIPDSDGAINTDLTDNAQDVVGGAIGNIANSHIALVTPQTALGAANVVANAQRKATTDNAKIVKNWYDDLFGQNSKVVPINNPLPGGPIGQIPGDAWREQNTALGQQIRRTNDGDLKYHLGQLQEHYFDAMHAGMSPEDQDLFGQLRGQYRNLKTIQPLAEKATDSGINPQLVLNRAISSKNSRGDVGELGRFAKDWLAKKYPDSGTAQRAMLYSGLVGGLGAAGNEIFGGGEDNQHGYSTGAALVPGAAMVAGGLLGRGLGSRALSAAYTARLPDKLSIPLKYGYTDVPLGSAVQAATSRLPAAAASEERADPDIPEFADGGSTAPEYKKSTFWDLVQQAIKEATTSNNPVPSQNATSPGTVPSGQVGADFDNRVQQSVTDQGG